jgi:protein-export SecD/SecF family membrane protein
MKRNKGVGFVIMALILIGATLIAGMSFTIYNEKGRTAFKIPGAEDIRLGIDIRGGVDAVFEPEDTTIDPSNDDLDHARSVIDLRMDKNNITDRDVTIDYAKNRILVRFPWKSDETDFNPQDALKELGQMGKLTFRDPDGNVILEGTDVKRAYYDTLNGANVVQLEFTADGTTKFSTATQKLVGKTISIYMDETLLSDPQVKSIITGGECYIEGSSDEFTAEYCRNQANLIASGSLPFKLVSRSNSSISPTMGKSALNLMEISGLIAFIMVCIFMLVVYRLPGFVACFALLGQVVGQLLTLSISQFTLTLPGIAGIILSIGMGVDANVISYERIKEEIFDGKTIRAAIDAGYNKAFSAVADGNVTVAIVAVLLWILGTGPMISFGFTLLIGVIFNFICGVGVSKIMLKSLTGLKFAQNKWLYGYLRKGEVKDA